MYLFQPFDLFQFLAYLIALLDDATARVQVLQMPTRNTYEALDLDRVLGGTEVGHLERLHVENVDTLELSEELETLKTGSLLLVGRHVTILGALTLDDGGTGGESERRRGEETRSRVDGGGGDAQSGGCAGNETAGGEEHVGEKSSCESEGGDDDGGWCWRRFEENVV